MTRKTRLALGAGAALLLIIALLVTLVVRERVTRRRVFRPAAGEAKTEAPQHIPPVEQWTATFATTEPEDLAELLEEIEVKHPDLYKKWSLAYVHARALVEDDEKSEAARKLAPFLEKGHPFRDRALYHRAAIAEGAEASKYRNTLIFEHRDSTYRDEAVDEELEYLGVGGDPQALLAFGEKIATSASTERRREISARIVEALAARKQVDAAFTRGMALLNAGNADDAADRVTRALDRPEVIGRLNAAQLALFGETFQKHRHYDRAVALLQLAIDKTKPAVNQAFREGGRTKSPAHTQAPAEIQGVVPHVGRTFSPAALAESGAYTQATLLAAARKKPAKKKALTPKKSTKKAPARKAAPPPPPPPPNPRARLDELEFALGRSHFGAERYAEAQAVYLNGARAATDLRMKSTFLGHAARAAQLRGDDKTAENLMTASIAVKGKFPSTTAALTQRIRTRLKARRFAEAASDVAQLRKMAGNERAILEGSLAYAVGMLAAGNSAAAVSALNSVPANLLDPYDKAEFAYWRARALEGRDPPASFRSYLEVLRAGVPTHFAYFARTRLDSAAMAPKLARELAVREAQVTNLVGAKNFDLARQIQTDRVLLSSKDRERQLQKLTAIYRELPAYRDVLTLAPRPLPRFPSVDANDPDSLLMAMGLHDEAVPAIQSRFPLRPASSALSRSYALNLGGASKDSIYAIEVMMKSVPNDFHPDLLPVVVRQLLYPRYFYNFIAEDAERYDADPGLVLSIMREESRFNPRAKSQAAARGLLQFIITTARDIGRDVGLVDVAPEDLYDPRVIIRLGAKYISELAGQFEGNRYRVAGAYNAGPKQVALWSRLQPAAGEDYFLTAVNFDETKHYIRKVMNSYERYAGIYGNAGPKGGLRAEP
ncbi:MAG TPA: lytic transglycosylase domain-containing protein [Thermoanaerobaculia bacterium]|nr:lytic transglycosylase domain-containing protein [Thermoanaerobaculia bacterium]